MDLYKIRANLLTWTEKLRFQRKQKVVIRYSSSSLSFFSAGFCSRSSFILLSHINNSDEKLCLPTRRIADYICRLDILSSALQIQSSSNQEFNKYNDW